MKKFTVKPRTFKSSQATFGAPTTETEESVLFGRLAEAGPLTYVHFDLSYPHVVAVFGKRGSGKSYTLGTLLEGLCTAQKETSISRNERIKGVLLFDTLGIFQWTDIPVSGDSKQPIIKAQYAAWRGWDLENERLDVVVWIPQGSRIATTPPTHREFTVNCADFTAADWAFLFGLDIYQDRMGQLLNDAYIKVVQEGWADEGTNHRPQKTYAIEDLIDCVQSDKELVASYHTETRRAVLQQLGTAWRNPIFQPKRKVPLGLSVLQEAGEVSQEDLVAFQAVPGTQLADLIRAGQLSVIVMNKLSDELRLLVMSALIRRIIASRIEASENEKHLRLLPALREEERAKIEKHLERSIPPCWVAIDEAQNVLPAERSTSATDVLIKFVREGRNYGLSFAVATQQPTSIDQRMLAQVDTIIAHKLTVQTDIDYVRKNLKSNLPEEIKYANNSLSFDELLRTLDVGQALVSNTESERAFIVDIRPRISVHGGF